MKTVIDTRKMSNEKKALPSSNLLTENPLHTKGLSESQVLKSRQQHGFNELPFSKPKSFWAIAFEVMKEPMFLLLIACGTLYLFLGDWQEGVFVASSVIVVIGITLYQERKTERALDAIKDLSSPRALVIREGEVKRIAGKEVVVGDFVMLKEGDRVPADGKIVFNVNLTVDESLLTGESVPVQKSTWTETQSLNPIITEFPN